MRVPNQVLRRRLQPAAFATVAVLLGGVAGCGGGVEPIGGGATASIDEGGCDDGGDCASGVDLNGHLYGITCAEPDKADLTEVVGGPGSADGYDEARALAGEPVDLVVALHVTSGASWCTAHPSWVLAIGSPTWQTEQSVLLDAHLRCEVPAVPEDPRCADGGPFWLYTDSSPDGTAGDGRSALYLPAAVAAANAELAAGRGPQRRLDPLQVVRAEIADYAERDTWLDDQEQLYRVGLRLLDQGQDSAVVEALFQSGQSQGSSPDFFSNQREQYTLERIGAGSGWYITTFLVTEYANQGEDPATRETLDRAWAECCDLVISELDRRTDIE